MLEELGVAYEVHGVDIGKGEQFEPEFLKISPNNKIPALIDNEGPGGESISIFESGAILIYLAEKFGRFFPTNVRDRYDVLQWVMFQMASIGPMLGQAHHFRAHTDEKIPYAIKRYTNEAHRLYRIMNEHLRNHEYFAAGQYSIADMLIYPWTRSHEKQGIELDKFPDFRNWFEKISARPAVQRGIQVLENKRSEMDAEQKKILFDQK